MKVAEVVRRIKQWKPRTPGDFKKAGIPLCQRAVGVGAFREAVRIRVCPELIVKFPLDESDDDIPDYSWGIRHSLLEMRRIKRLSRFRWMRKHLPKVYYYERVSGVIVMQYYPYFENDDYFDVATGKFINELLWRATGIRFSDYHGGNIREGAKRGKYSETGYPILIDLGY